MPALETMTVTIKADTTDIEQKLAALTLQALELRAALRSWWCPRWVFNVVNPSTKR